MDFPYHGWLCCSLSRGNIWVIVLSKWGRRKIFSQLRQLWSNILVILCLFFDMKLLLFFWWASDSLSVLESRNSKDDLFGWYNCSRCQKIWWMWIYLWISWRPSDSSLRIQRELFVLLFEVIFHEQIDHLIGYLLMAVVCCLHSFISFLHCLLSLFSAVLVISWCLIFFPGSRCWSKLWSWDRVGKSWLRVQQWVQIYLWSISSRNDWKHDNVSVFLWVPE